MKYSLIDVVWRTLKRAKNEILKKGQQEQKQDELKGMNEIIKKQVEQTEIEKREKSKWSWKSQGMYLSEIPLQEIFRLNWI